MSWSEFPDTINTLCDKSYEPALEAVKAAAEKNPDAIVWYNPTKDCYIVANTDESLGLDTEFIVPEPVVKYGFHSVLESYDLGILVKGPSGKAGRFDFPKTASDILWLDRKLFPNDPVRAAYRLCSSALLNKLACVQPKFLKLASNDGVPFFYKLIGVKEGGPLPPVPATTLLVGSLLGAGGGWLTGAAAGKLLKWLVGEWDEKKLRETATKLGLLIGLTPGTIYYLMNVGEGRGMLGSLFAKGYLATRHPNAWKKRAADDWVVKVPIPSPTSVKPTIDVDSTSRMIMGDPHADPDTKAKMLGILNAASIARNPMADRSPVVSPYDIIRVGLGMGTGYTSATVMGRLLENYAGAPPSVRKRLEEAGIWAGMMKNVANMVF